MSAITTRIAPLAQAQIAIVAAAAAVPPRAQILVVKPANARQSGSVIPERSMDTQ